MSDAGGAPVVFCDANVMYPPSIRDLLQEGVLRNLLRARWSEDVRDEWFRNVLKNNPKITEDKLERLHEEMQNVRPECLIARSEYKHLVRRLRMKNKKDRHVVAAALAGECDFILTRDKGLLGQDLQMKSLFGAKFRKIKLPDRNIQAISPDGFLCDLFDGNSSRVCAAVRSVRSRMEVSRPTVAEHLEILSKAGLPNLSARLASMSNEL